jgi:hypothetical protein
MKLPTLILGLMMSVIGLGFFLAYEQEISPSLLPTRSRFYPPYAAFPATLFCEYIDSMTDGPTWGEITIGSSNAEDLKDYVRTIGNFDSIDQWADYISFARTGGLQDESGIPPLIEACIDLDTQVVTALRLSVNEAINIQDMVTEFGIPDTVTWGSSNISRTLFWFDKGIASSVYILEDSEILDYGEIGLIVYFPFQTEDDFEERWPFLYTNIENPVGGDRLYLPQPSEAQNPFNFEGIAAITVEPERTPIWIFNPTSIATAIP